jgi:hypothetical protein
MLGSYLQPVPTESVTKAHYIIFPPWISVQDKKYTSLEDLPVESVF